MHVSGITNFTVRNSNINLWTEWVAKMILCFNMEEFLTCRISPSFNIFTHHEKTILHKIPKPVNTILISMLNDTKVVL